MDSLLADLEALLGVEHVLTGAAATGWAFSPWTRLGAPRAILRPVTTQEVSGILRLAHAAGAAVVPWGGRTGLVDGAFAEDALALSLDRMAAIE